jgi:N4-gp56 family major capsid protein
MAKYENGVNQDIIFYAERNALKNAQEAFVMGKLTDKKSLPKFYGHSYKVHFWQHIPTTEVNDLQEGVTPSSTDLVRVAKTGSLARKGMWIPITDEFSEYHENSPEFAKEASTELGYSLGTALDKDAVDVAYAGAGTQLDLAVDFGGDVDKALVAMRNALRKANAPKFTKVKSGSTKVGTKPVAGGWYIIASIEDCEILKTASDFLPVEDYSYSDGIMENEIGVIKSLGLRIIESLNATVGQVVAVADGALGEISLSGAKNIEYIHKALGSEGSTDPLNQRGSTGVKSRSVVFVMREEYLVALKTA